MSPVKLAPRTPSNNSCWINKVTLLLELFSNVFRITNTKVITPSTTATSSAMNQPKFLQITCNWFKAREKWRVQGAIGFGFTSHWLKSLREIFKPIAQRSNGNRFITFDSHLKTDLNSAKSTSWMMEIFCDSQVYGAIWKRNVFGPKQRRPVSSFYFSSNSGPQAWWASIETFTTPWATTVSASHQLYDQTTKNN